MENRETSFWRFLSNYKLEIPIIQRDYAQGREGKEFLRKNFLTSLKGALDRTKVKLDFVYGANESGVLQPLDGQQRLTTLWLLHWYIALKAKKLKEANMMLSRFSYETRMSSREFCQCLCDSSKFEDYQKGSVADFIETRTWFYQAWKQDPTIQSMLRMIRGTKVHDKKGIDIVDGLEEIFSNTSEQQFGDYWNKLISEDAPIVFYYQPLEDFGLSDELYVKMNARGKQLTAFENFKADLVGYITEQAETNDDWKELMDPLSGIPILLDNNWTDIFWKNLNKENKIDDIYLTFMNRFFWKELFMVRKIQDDETQIFVLPLGEGKLNDGTKVNAREQHNASYIHLNDDKGNYYADFTPYRYLDGSIPKDFFLKIRDVLQRYAAYKKPIPSPDWVEDFNFIPCYEVKKDGGEGAEAINQIQRVAFYAICKYLQEGDAEEVSFKRWMRVVWNLISGEGEDGHPQIRSTRAMRVAMEKIEPVESHNVYEYLKNKAKQKTEGEISDIDKRWNEEIEKAKKILDDKDCLSKFDGSKTWEDVIISAENWGFFKGRIRFLFTDGKGNVCWDDFNTKWENAQRYFSQSRDGSSMGEQYHSTQLLKALISRISPDKFDSVLWWNHRFSNKASIWMYYLINQNIHDIVHELLMGNDTPMILSNNFQSDKERYVYLLSNTGLLDFIRGKNPDAWWIRPYHNHIAIYPSSTGVFLNAEKRDTFLLNQHDIKVDEDSKIENTGLLYGSDIYFEFNAHRFLWYRTDFIYAIDDAGTYLVRDNNVQKEEEKYYCFKAKDLVDKCIFEELNKLINEIYK